MAYNQYMPREDQITAFLNRLVCAIDEDRVQITWKADDEIAALGWSREDAFRQLMVLDQADLLRTEPAKNPDFSLIWVFCPFAWGSRRTPLDPPHRAIGSDLPHQLPLRGG